MRDTGCDVSRCWRLITAILIAVVVAAASIAGNGFAKDNPQQEQLGVVKAVEGDTKIQRAGQAEFNPVKVNDPLFFMDFLSTDKKSKLWWQGTFNAYSRSGDWSPLPDKTHGSLGADSIFGFLEWQRIGYAYRFVGKVTQGTVRFIKQIPPTDPPSKFIIATPTAWIEVIPTDRAADFVVHAADKSLTVVTVLWGKVKVKNISTDLKETRILTSCQEVDVERDKDPGSVRWVSTDTMKKLIKRTTIPDTLPTDVPSCERVKTETILEPGRVIIPPPGVILFPVPFPIPPGGDPGDECPCPPGSFENPQTGQCECCPPGHVYNETECDCRCPCPEGQMLHPQTQECLPCRESARYDAQNCRCECPCPQGQVLLPGEGCIPQCPEGFTVQWDISSTYPYRCPYCVRQPDIPPPEDCGPNNPCENCEECIRGNCVPKVCEDRMILNRQTCECEPIVKGPPTCQTNQDCPRCQQCREGQCHSVILCGPGERLNTATCQCEPVRTTTTPQDEPKDECTSNRDCPQGQLCRDGKCVDKPPQDQPPVSRTPPQPTVTFDDSDFDDPFFEDPRPPRRRPFRPPAIQFGIGIGIGGGGGPKGGGPRDTPRGPNQ